MKHHKPLGHKAYGSIPHLPGSRQGREDKGLSAGQAKFCLTELPDRHYRVIIQEKMDGACVSVARHDGRLITLGRAGYEASTSPYPFIQMFDVYVKKWKKRFTFLQEGERLVGEWLALAHGTLYEDLKDPFVAFDLMTEHRRATFGEFLYRLPAAIQIPVTLPTRCPMGLEDAIIHTRSFWRVYKADRMEGLVYRVEKNDEVLFLGKYVRPLKKDGCYLADISGGEDIWNWGGKK
ncbi:MAG TPA: hypothetical protein ENI27_03390 [bacterium]|nr:hypothetical protein [bacterium]